MKLIKNIIIFVEGSDGIGKSTLAKKLSNKLHIPLLKMPKAKTAFNTNSIEEVAYVFNQVLLQLKNTSYIVDRGPISSLVYSKYYKRNSKLEYIYSIIKKLNPLVIYLTSSDIKTMFNRKKNDIIINTSSRIALHKLYMKFFNSTLIHTYAKVLQIDTKNKTAHKVLLEILQYLKLHKYYK